MTQKKSGEFGWIEQIRRQFGALVPSGAEGIGDDGAVIPLSDRQSLVVTTDMLIEGVHFVRSAIRPEDLGYKTLAVNLSDVAAMGAVPIASFLSVGWPADVSEAWREGFLQGYRSLSEEFGVPLLGGDTTASGRIVLSVTALGKVSNERIKRRNGARVGDLICLTGSLGDSAAGLVIQTEQPENEAEKQLLRAHHRPRPYIKEGEWLGGQRAVHAMMDVSDGIASDLRHILDESGVSARIDLDRLPISAALRDVAARRGWDAEQLAAAGGEDYVLLLTVDPQAFEAVNREYHLTFGTPLHPIGTIEAAEAEPSIAWSREGKIISINWQGFTHF
ncbi:MAG: thiamine-phosphate kinase [Rikenellaceae bacterium]|jgi:thiamine-monophosphate kinase|nr:thiamine-phosphate kinase [Rikenellaceae bacterium]